MSIPNAQEFIEALEIDTLLSLNEMNEILRELCKEKIDQTIAYTDLKHFLYFYLTNEKGKSFKQIISE